MLKLKRRNKKLLLISRILVAASITVLIIGGFVAWKQHQAGQTASPPPTSQEVAGSPSGETKPETQKPKEDAFANYKVPTDMPRYIFIPKLAIKAMVKPLGLTPEGRIDVPANIHDAGWYSQSAKPGTRGATFIDGHVGWRSEPGIFYQLKNLQPGDKIIIQKGNDEKLNYTTIRVQTYPADQVDMVSALAPVNTDKPGLNLITCDGNVLPDNQYDKRLVVFAELQ